MCALDCIHDRAFTAKTDVYSKGYILEASPLPKLPVIGLQGVEERSGPLHVILGHQSQEDQDINGRDTQIEYKAVIPRFPFILLLDGIVGDPSI